jgi:hypothetical protein
MSEFVKEYVIQHESADGEHRPLLTSFGSKSLRRLALHEEPGQADAGRQSTQGNVPAPLIHITEPSSARGPIVEMDCAKALPEFHWKTTKDNSNVFLADMVNSITARNRC